MGNGTLAAAAPELLDALQALIEASHSANLGRAWARDLWDAADRAVANATAAGISNTPLVAAEHAARIHRPGGPIPLVCTEDEWQILVACVRNMDRLLARVGVTGLGALPALLAKIDKAEAIREKVLP